ncbi:MAG TPA: hypothetical protein VL201_00810, partial [Patescibacteria group bacterium]|nr:hypothetical protein [Patescibacteria group bacterium]
MWIFIYVHAIACIFSCILHGMQAQDITDVFSTTDCLVKISKDACITYALCNEYIKGSTLADVHHDGFSLSAEPFPFLSLNKEAGQKCLDNDMISMILYPLTLPEDIQQFAYFNELSFDKLWAIACYYHYLNIASIVKNRVDCHCIVRWFLDNAVEDGHSFIEKSIQALYKQGPSDFYTFGVSESYRLFRIKAQATSKINPILKLPLPTTEKIFEPRLYRTLASLRYINDRLLTKFFQKQSLEELKQIYDVYQCFLVDPNIQNCVQFYILLKIFEQEKATALLRKFILIRHYHFTDDETKRIRTDMYAVFEKYKEIPCKNLLDMLGALVFTNYLDPLMSLDLSVLKYLFISKKEESYCLHITKFDDINFLKHFFKDLFEKIEILNIDISLPAKQSEREGFWNKRKLLPSLKRVDLVNSTNENDWLWKNNDLKYFIHSAFFKSIEKPDLSEDYPSYDITFEPLSVYVSSNVSKHTRECLVHYKNFLVTRCVKSALENFFYWALITGGVSLGGGAFFTPPVHLLFSEATFYNKNEILIQVALIAGYGGSVFLQLYSDDYNTEYPNKYIYSLSLSVLGLLLFYSYYAYYEAKLKKDLLETFFSSSKYLCLILDILSVGNLGYYSYVKKEEAKEIGKIL